jgi:hypothetical protein
MNFPYQRDTFETSNSTPIYDATREVAANYIDLGFAVTPVRFMGKNPIIPEWQKHPIGKEDVDNRFGREPTNIGVLLGTPSGGLVDIDLDDNDAVQFASVFLPATDMVFGRTSRPVAGCRKARKYGCGAHAFNDLIPPLFPMTVPVFG